MKKLLFISVFSAVCFFSCYNFANIEKPETLSVSSKATYEFPAGEMSFEIKEKLGIDKFKEILEKNSSESSISVYDYNPPVSNPDNAPFQYIINYPIKEIPISISGDTDVGDMTFSTDFAIPDFSDTVADDLKFENQKIIVPEGNNAQISDVMESPFIFFNITSPDFDTMTLRSGKIKVTFTKDSTSTPSSDFSMPVKLILVPANDPSKVISTSDQVDCANGGTVELDLAGKEILPSLLLCMDGSVSGGSLGKSNTYDISIAPDSIAISKVTGLNMDLGSDAHVEVDETFALSGMNEALKSANIKSGSVSFDCNFPSDWTGVTCKKNFSLSDGINVSNSEFTHTETTSTANLSGKTLIPNDVSTSGSYVDIEISDATLIFSESGDKVSLTGSCKIDEIDELILDLGASSFTNLSDTIETGLNFSSLLSDFFEGDDNTNLIKNIKFSGIDAYMFITQPTENEVLKGLAVTGKVSATYTGLASPEYLVGTASEDAVLPMKKSDVTFKSLADENSVISSSLLFDEHENEADNLYSCKVNENTMTNIINAHPDGLAFNYDLALSGSNGTEVILTQEDLAVLNSNSSLSISLAIIIPLQIILDDVTDGDSSDETIIIDDVLELMGSGFDDDMLKRDDTSDSEDWLDYTPIIKSIALKYSLENTTPLDNLKITFLSQKSDGTDILDAKELDTSDGNHTLSFSREDVETVCKTCPFIPRIKVEIGGADGSTPRVFTRNAGLDFMATFEVKTDGKIKVWDKNEDD